MSITLVAVVNWNKEMLMKNNFKNTMVICLSLLMAWLTTACQDECEPIQESEQVTEIPVKVRATHVGPVPLSRLGYTDSDKANEDVTVKWGDSEKIKVFVKLTRIDETKQEIPWKAAYMAIQSVSDDGKTAEFAGVISIPGSHEVTENAKVFAFYPITSEMAQDEPGLDVSLRRVVTDYQCGIDQMMYYDYMVAEGIYNEECIELDFKHQVAMLRLDLTMPATSVVRSINEVKIQSNDLVTQGAFSVDAASLSLTRTEKEADSHIQYVQWTANQPKTSTSGTKMFTAYTMLMPGTFTAANPMTVTVEAGGDIYESVVTFSKDNVVAAGKRYVLEATLQEKIVADYSWYEGKSSPYRLVDEGDLRGFSNLTNGTNLPSDLSQDQFDNKVVLLDKDVELTADWIPAGNSKQFLGTFDGQGHTISNIHIDRENAISQALFSSIGGTQAGENALIQNLTVSGDVTCYDGGAGLVGIATQSSVVNCRNQANVVIKSDYVGLNAADPDQEMFPCAGGIIAYSAYSSVIACVNEGNIDGGSKGTPGGLVGFNTVGMVLASYNVGSIVSEYHASGIIGCNWYAGPDLYGKAVGCFNDGALMGSSSYAISDTNNRSFGCFYVQKGTASETSVKYSSTKDLNSTNYQQMNEAIAEHNKGYMATDIFYSCYQWKPGAIYPQAEKTVAGGGTTGNYDDGGKLGD